MAAKKTTQKNATGPYIFVPSTTICTVPDCDKPVFVRGLCEAHWEDPKA